MIQTIRIHGHWWKVELVPGLKDADGERVSGLCDGSTFGIKVEEALHSQMARTTLWHEVLHACLPELSEKQIAHIERETYTVLNDNPALAPFLMGKQP